MSEPRSHLAGGNCILSGIYSVILVDSTSHALRIEKLLHRQGLANKLIPTPRQLSSDCGVCVRVRYEDVETIRRLLDDQQAAYQSIMTI